MTFYDFHVSKNLFTIENLLLIPNHWQKYTKVTILSFLKYRYTIMAERQELSSNSEKEFKTEKEGIEVIAHTSLCTAMVSKSNRISCTKH